MDAQQDLEAYFRNVTMWRREKNQRVLETLQLMADRLGHTSKISSRIEELYRKAA